MGRALASTPSSSNDQGDPPLRDCRRNRPRVNSPPIPARSRYPHYILCRDSLAGQLSLSGRLPHLGLPDSEPISCFRWAKLVAGKWYRYGFSWHAICGQVNRTAGTKPMGRRGLWGIDRGNGNHCPLSLDSLDGRTLVLRLGRSTTSSSDPLLPYCLCYFLVRVPVAVSDDIRRFIGLSKLH